MVHGLKDASYKPVTGEEDETCALQLRAKLYRLTEVRPAGPEGGAGGGEAAPSQPQPQPRRDWVECGVGQAKILVPQSRQDGTEPGAAGAGARLGWVGLLCDDGVTG